MNRVFNFEGPFFTLFSRLADLFWLNLLFILCCIPVITAGASATAMYYVTLKMAKNEEGYITRSFFKSFKENFVQATVIWIVFLIVLAIMLVDYRIAAGGDIAVMLNTPYAEDIIIVLVGVMAIVVGMTLIYVFPILAQFENSIKNTIKNSFLISVRHLPYTFLMLVITIVPFVLIWFFPGLFIIVMIMFSAIAYINSKFFNKIFVLYMPKEDPDNVSGDPAEGFNGEV